MYNGVNADPVAKNMFDNFRQIQMNLQQRQMMGQEISEQEVQQAQATVASSPTERKNSPSYAGGTADEHDYWRAKPTYYEAFRGTLRKFIIGTKSFRMIPEVFSFLTPCSIFG